MPSVSEDWPAIEAVADDLLDYIGLAQTDVQRIARDHEYGGGFRKRLTSRVRGRPAWLRLAERPCGRTQEHGRP